MIQQVESQVQAEREDPELRAPARIAEQLPAVDALHVDARAGAGMRERLGVRRPAAGTCGSRWRLDTRVDPIVGPLGALLAGQGVLLLDRASIMAGR